MEKVTEFLKQVLLFLAPHKIETYVQKVGSVLVAVAAALGFIVKLFGG